MGRSKSTVSISGRSGPLKLLVVVPAYEPAWAFGGVVRSVSNLCRTMARLGVDVSVYTTNADGQRGCLDVPVSRAVSVNGVAVTYLPSSLGPSPAWASRPMHRKLEQTISGFDAVYISAIWQWIGISACRIARQNRIPYVISPHGSFLAPALRCGRLKKLAFWYGVLARCIKTAAALRFTTEFERRGSQSFLPEKASFMVPNSVLVDNGTCRGEDARVNTRCRLGVSKEDFLLLTVTRAHPNKRVDVVIEALQSIRRAGRSARLLVVGPFDNKHGHDLKTLAARRNVSDAIVWAGYQSGEALEACYCASDLFVLPSAHENFCMAAAEAMAHGLPIVISKYVGIADDVERHRAGIVTDLDVEQVAHAALCLTDCDKRREMGRRARDMATQLYGGERVACLVLRAFEDILTGTRSPECVWQSSCPVAAGDVGTRGSRLSRAGAS